MIITMLIDYIRHVKMQLNDVIKSIGWYRAFVALQYKSILPKIAPIPIPPIPVRYHWYRYRCITGYIATIVNVLAT